MGREMNPIDFADHPIQNGRQFTLYVKGINKLSPHIFNLKDILKILVLPNFHSL